MAFQHLFGELEWHFMALQIPAFWHFSSAAFASLFLLKIFVIDIFGYKTQGGLPEYIMSLTKPLLSNSSFHWDKYWSLHWAFTQSLTWCQRKIGFSKDSLKRAKFSAGINEHSSIDFNGFHSFVPAENLSLSKDFRNWSLILFLWLLLFLATLHGYIFS